MIKNNRILKIRLYSGGILVLIILLLLILCHSSLSFKFKKTFYSISCNDQELIKLGNYYFNKGEYNLSKAKSSYEAIINCNNFVALAHYQLSRIYFIEGKFESALQKISDTLSVDNNFFRAYYMEGLIYSYQKKLAKAEISFMKFIENAPSEWAGYNDLAWVYAMAKEYKESEKVINEAFINVPEANKNPWLWNSLGVALLNLNRNVEARDAFNKALEYGKKLSPNEWKLAYPGNNPNHATQGYNTFINSIDENILKAKVKM